MGFAPATPVACVHPTWLPSVHSRRFVRECGNASDALALTKRKGKVFFPSGHPSAPRAWALPPLPTLPAFIAPRLPSVHSRRFVRECGDASDALALKKRKGKVFFPRGHTSGSPRMGFALATPSFACRVATERVFDTSATWTFPGVHTEGPFSASGEGVGGGVAPAQRFAHLRLEATTRCTSRISRRFIKTHRDAFEGGRRAGVALYDLRVVTGDYVLRRVG